MKTLVPHFDNFFRYIKKYTPYFVAIIKLFVYFMSDGNKLVDARVTCLTTGLITWDRATSVNWVLEQPLQNFTADWQQRYWSVVFQELFVFFMDRNNICFRPLIGKTTLLNEVFINERLYYRFAAYFKHAYADHIMPMSFLYTWVLYTFFWYPFR